MPLFMSRILNFVLSVTWNGSRAGEQFWVGVFGNAKLCTVEVDLMKFTEKVTERFRNF